MFPTSSNSCDLKVSDEEEEDEGEGDGDGDEEEMDREGEGEEGKEQQREEGRIRDRENAVDYYDRVHTGNMDRDRDGDRDGDSGVGGDRGVRDRSVAHTMNLEAHTDVGVTELVRGIGIGIGIEREIGREIGRERGVELVIDLDVPCVSDDSGLGVMGDGAGHGNTSHASIHLCPLSPSSSSSLPFSEPSVTDVCSASSSSMCSSFPSSSGYMNECGVTGDVSSFSITPQSLSNKGVLISAISSQRELRNNELAIRSSDTVTSTGILNEYQ